MKTEPLYRKVGRKYVPVSAYWPEETHQNRQAVGTFRLIYAYADGGRRFEYDVTPATAPTVAAMMIAKHAMCEAIREASKTRPQGGMVKFNKKQVALIKKFREDMGSMYPEWWSEAHPHEVADAAIKAVMEFRP